MCVLSCAIQLVSLRVLHNFGSMGKNPGDSGTVSDAEAVFTNRIYIYHETYLPAETTVKLAALYKEHHISVILRSVDYLAATREQATSERLKRELATP